MSELVWQSQLDDRYDCRVTRNSYHEGTLVVEDKQDGRQLLEKKVTLSYGAQFGPDMFDVAAWQDDCIAVVDAQQ